MENMFAQEQWEKLERNYPIVKYCGISILEINSLQKTAQEAICSQTESPLLPERCMNDHTVISMK